MKNKLVGSLFLAVLLLLFAKPILAAPVLDSDHDGLNDALELKFKTDPKNPDSDGDGFKDGEEVDWDYNPLSTTTVKLPQRIEINLKKQRLYYFVGGVQWKEFKVSTGKAKMPTPKGQFKIRNKITKAWSKDYQLWMPYWLGLTSKIGIHQLPIWPNGYQENAKHLGIPVSHGCIRLGLKEAPYLFARVVTGVSVKIY